MSEWKGIERLADRVTSMEDGLIETLRTRLQPLLDAAEKLYDGMSSMDHVRCMAESNAMRKELDTWR